MKKTLKAVDGGGEKQEKKKEFEEVGGFTVEQVLQLNQWLLMATGSGSLGVKLHYWATYCAGKLKPAVNAYSKAIQSDPDNVAYIEAIRAPGADMKAVNQQFSDYVQRRTSLLKEVVNDITIRKVRAEWCLQGTASSPISAALIEFDLLDNPDELMNLIYEG